MTTALRRIIFIAMIAVIWEVTSRFSVLPDFMFPRLTQVLETLFNGMVSGQMLEAIGKSMSRLLTGFAIAIVLGVIMGYLIWRYKLVEDTLGFLVTALQSIPSIVWFPLAIIWFGLNDFSILFIVTIGATWTMTVSATSGFKNVPTAVSNGWLRHLAQRGFISFELSFACFCSAINLGSSHCLGVFMEGIDGRGIAWFRRRTRSAA